MSRSLFDDLDASPSGGMESADARTLRLAAPALTREGLDALIRYQEAFLAHMEQPSVGAEGIATAHERGLQASGLGVKELELGTSLLRAYCGQRWTARQVRGLVAELARQSGPGAAERLEGAQDKLRRLGNLEPLARRYGQEAVELLESSEERLVDLHARMQQALLRA